MVEFKNILLTTDLSSNAGVARPYAIDLAKRYGGTLHLLHVFEDAGYYLEAGGVDSVPFGPVEWIERTQAERRKELIERAALIEKEGGVRTIPELRIGHAVTEILAHAKENKADLIVMATHGHTGVAHFVFGSVAEKVVRMSTCPVMTVRPV